MKRAILFVWDLLVVLGVFVWDLFLAAVPWVLAVGSVCVALFWLFGALAVAPFVASYDGLTMAWWRRTVAPSLETWKADRLRILLLSSDRIIHRAPGWRLYAVASWVCSRRTFSTVFEPVISDMQVEYLEALAEGRPRKAAWVRVRGTLVFLNHVVAQLPVSAARMIWTLWRSAQ